MNNYNQMRSQLIANNVNKLIKRVANFPYLYYQIEHEKARGIQQWRESIIRPQKKNNTTN